MAFCSTFYARANLLAGTQRNSNERICKPSFFAFSTSRFCSACTSSSQDFPSGSRLPPRVLGEGGVAPRCHRSYLSRTVAGPWIRQMKKSHAADGPATLPHCVFMFSSFPSCSVFYFSWCLELGVFTHVYICGAVGFKRSRKFSNWLLFGLAVFWKNCHNEFAVNTHACKECEASGRHT